MKLNKKLACLAIVGALSLSTVSAFAAPCQRALPCDSYDVLMVKAEELYAQGMYYEADEAIEMANAILPGTVQYDALKPAIDLKIALLEIAPSFRVLPKAFAAVGKLMDEGLYYEAKAVLDQAKSDFADKIAESVEYSNKVQMLDEKINEKIAEVEFNEAIEKVWKLYDAGKYYEAQDAVNAISAPACKEKALADAVRTIAWKVDNIAATPEAAIQIVKTDANIPHDPDFRYEATPVYLNKHLDGYTVLVYSAKAYQLGYGSTISSYYVDLEGNVVLMSN